MYFIMPVINRHLLTAYSTFGVGSFLDLSSDGNTLYTTDASTENLRIYDITNIASPVLKSTTSTGANTKPMGIRVNGNFAYICYRHATNQGLAVWNVSNPVSPTYVTAVSLTTPVRVIIEPTLTYAYVINGTEPGGSGNGTHLYVITITTPSAPTLTGTYTGAAGRYPTGLVKNPAGNHIFVSTANALTGLQVISIATPSAPTNVGEVSTAPNFSPNSIECDEGGNWVYMACADNVASNNFVTVNCISKAGPSVDHYTTLGTAASAWLGCAVRYGSTLYQEWNGNLYTFQVSSPSTPTLLQTVTSSPGILNDIQVSQTRNIALACDATTVLHLLTMT